MTLTRPTATLEERREALHAHDASLNSTRKAQAREVWGLYLAWKLLYPHASTREFVCWLGYGEFQGRFYGYLHAGLALEKGLDTPHKRLGDLARDGERLLNGETAQQVASTPAPKRETTTLRLSRATADNLTAAMSELSEADSALTREEALELVVQGFASARPVIRRALVRGAETGEDTLDALISAVEERRDYRAWMKRQPCAVPGCGVHGVELHHLRATPDSRFRSTETLLPICPRHHQAQPGLHSEAAHATTQADWIARNWDSEAAFWRDLAALYIRYAQASDSGSPKEAP